MERFRASLIVPVDLSGYARLDILQFPVRDSVLK